MSRKSKTYVDGTNIEELTSLLQYPPGEGDLAVPTNGNKYIFVNGAWVQLGGSSISEYTFFTRADMVAAYGSLPVGAFIRVISTGRAYRKTEAGIMCYTHYEA
jgi:hypothetical protein